jgi:NDP-sugar pyrophosphorylase family protein
MSETRSVHGIVVAGAYPAARSTLDTLVPRPLLPVAQQPLISYALRFMREGGIETATVCTNSAARVVRTRLGAAPLGLRLDYLEDWNPRGAAGCVRDAGARTSARTFVVADGTAVPVAAVSELLEAHHSTGAALTVVVGADATGRLCPSGVYVFDRRAFDFIAAEGFQDIKERLIPKLYEAGEHVATHVTRRLAPRVVNVDSYLALDQWAVERAAEAWLVGDDYKLSGEALVHASTRVDPTARLLGPMLLGPAVEVSAGATLVGPLSIGKGTRIGRGAVVSRSVLWGGCDVGDQAVVDRCMLADRAKVAARRPLFATVRADERQGAGGLGSGREYGEPLVGVLRPSPGQL